MMGVIAGLSVVEMTAVHVLLTVFLAGQVLPHVLLGALHAYGILWVIGDRRLMVGSWHSLGEASLELHVGLRFRAHIPYQRILKILPLRNDGERRSVQPKKGRNPKATPFDSPNVHLCLDGALPFTTYFGFQRHAEHLDLYVDDPADFIAALLPKTNVGSVLSAGTSAPTARWM